MLKLDYDNSFKRRFIQFLTYIFRRRELKRFNKNYKFFLKILNYSLEKYKTSKDDKFIESYLLLSNKFLIDVQSAKILCVRGLYGSSHVLVTVIIRTLRMAGALLLSPELIPEYLEEEKNSDSNDEFRKKFSEGKLKRILDDRFGKTKRGDYANDDKVLHGSSVGAKIFYARIRHNPNGTKGGDLIYDAFFEEEKSSAILNILCGALFDMCGIFIEKYQDDEFIKAIRSGYDDLHKAELKSILRQQIIENMDARRSK